jgi:hypothetical protein
MFSHNRELAVSDKAVHRVLSSLAADQAIRLEGPLGMQNARTIPVQFSSLRLFMSLLLGIWQEKSGCGGWI